MTPEWFASIAPFLTIWFWVKAFFIALTALFFVFSLVVGRQVDLMGDYVETELAPFLRLVSILFSLATGILLVLVWFLI